MKICNHFVAACLSVALSSTAVATSTMASDKIPESSPQNSTQTQEKYTHEELMQSFRAGVRWRMEQKPKAEQKNVIFIALDAYDPTLLSIDPGNPIFRNFTHDFFESQKSGFTDEWDYDAYVNYHKSLAEAKFGGAFPEHSFGVDDCIIAEPRSEADEFDEVVLAADITNKIFYILPENLDDADMQFGIGAHEVDHCFQPNSVQSDLRTKTKIFLNNERLSDGVMHKAWEFIGALDQSHFWKKLRSYQSARDIGHSTSLFLKEHFNGEVELEHINALYQFYRILRKRLASDSGIDSRLTHRLIAERPALSRDITHCMLKNGAFEDYNDIMIAFITDYIDAFPQVLRPDTTINMAKLEAVPAGSCTEKVLALESS